MMSKKIWDSRDVPPEIALKALSDAGADIGEEKGDKSRWSLPAGGHPAIENFMISIPNISLGNLKKFSGSYLVGGGKKECLDEIKILMDTFNIRYKMVNKFIYG